MRVLFCLFGQTVKEKKFQQDSNAYLGDVVVRHKSWRMDVMSGEEQRAKDLLTRLF